VREARVVSILLCAVAMMILLAACGGQQVPPEPTIIRLPDREEAISPAPTCTPTATPTATPVPPPVAQEPTSTPTSTPSPSPAAVSEPEASSTAAPPPLEGRFVFQMASGGDIYSVNADGSGLTLLTRGMDPSWSPDGSQIAFARWTTPWGIYTMNADGSNERLLFSSNVARAPVWSPDGSQIAFYFETEGMTPPWREYIERYGWITLIPAQLQTEWHLGVADVADGYFHQPYCDRFAFSPTWAEGGTWLIYDGDHGLSTTTVEGPNNQPFSDNVHDHYPVSSPDGGRIAFMHWQHDHWEIYVMNADGSGRWPLTGSSALLERRPNNVSPAWSPDGRQIAFLSDRGGDWEFYVMNADGSDQRKILEEITDRLKPRYMNANERVISWSAG
jgi:dipeptidyl aminopeptidase/acylaminoacyl peptidase